MDLTGKKLLVLGGIQLICKLVKNAQSRGAHVIVADYLPDSPAKKVADEAWLISTTDIDGLAHLCKENNVDGVMAGYDDFNIMNAAKLSDVIDRPFYATCNQVLNTMDKARFKELCRKTGVPSMPEFEMDENMSRVYLDKIMYPVIVKPVDRSGSIGISICYNEPELIQAYKKAKDLSRKGRIIIEKYVVSDEIGVTYVLQNGEVYCCAIHDRYMQEDGNKNDVRISLSYVYPSKYSEKYMKEENQLVINMFKSIGMTQGTLFLQGCIEDGVCYFYEMGYRLSGAYQYELIQYLCGFNPMEMIVNYSLLGKEAEESIADKVNPLFEKAVATISVLVRPGVIGKIIGLDVIEKSGWILENNLWATEGDEIKESYVGTQHQIIMRCHVIGDNMDQLADNISNFYSTLKVLDTNGNNMILKTFDTAKLF